MLKFAHEVRNRHRGLWLVGALNLALAALCLVLMVFDSRTVLGLNVWTKPFKFAISVGVYLWTVAWFLPHLRISPRWRSGLGWLLAIIMLVENTLLFSQSLRGVRSHFNDASAYDGAIFASMGILILINSAVVLILFFLFLARPARLPGAYLWGIRLGFLLLILGSLEGGLMISKGAHTVGAADGGSGLPLLGWSTKAGDLRPAHLIGLHGLQILPLLGYWLSRRKQWTDRRQTTALFVCSAAYTLIGVLLFWQAVAADPLLPLYD